LESHEPEPSYYEVALTNRQVVTGFVILLACLFAAFLSGVWLGKGGGESPSAAATIAQAAPVDATQKPVEQLSFFNNRDAGARAARPVTEPPAVAPAATPQVEPPAPRPADTEADKLRQTLEAEMAAHRDAAPSATPAPVAAPGTRVRRATTAPAKPAAAAPTHTDAAPSAPEAAPAGTAAPTTASAPTAASTWIQVYSSTNGPNARNLASRLRKNGYKTVVLEAAASGGTNFRVRVGPYTGRDEAEPAAARLRREFRLDTWITDTP